MLAMSAFVLTVCAVRYSQFQYEGLDLGIYHQVLWNTARGRLFQFSFNEPLYLVDHREWLLVLFVPLYWVVNHSFVLIVLQTLAVQSAAIPCYLLIRHLIPSRPRAALVGSMFALLHPTVLNMQFFEFHMLAFIVPLFFWWWYGVVTRSWWRWIFFIVLLLLREDVAMTTAAAGVVIFLLEYRRWKEALLVVVSSVIWFGLMVWAGAYFSIEDTPLFFSLYAWMGDSPVHVLQYMALHPFKVLAHLLSINNLFLTLLFLMSSALLPLLSWRTLLPALTGLLVYCLMSAVDIGMGILLYHYGAPIAACTIIGGIYGYKRLVDPGTTPRIPLFTQKDVQQLSGPVIMALLIVSTFLFGPQWLVVGTAIARQEEYVGMQHAVATIPDNASVLTSDRTYPQLSSRQELYSAKYTQTGMKHYSELPYVFRPFQWALLSDDTVRVWNHHTIEEKTKAAQRLKEQIEANHLVPLQLFEQGVLYGPQSEGGVVAAPIIDGPTTMQYALEQRVHPTVQLHGYTYDVQAQQFQLQLERLGDDRATAFIRDHVNSQDVHVRVSWKNSVGLRAHTQYRLLGSMVDPLYTWQQGQVRTMTLPWKWPETARDVQLEFGTLEVPKQSFMVSQSVSLVFQPLPDSYSDINTVVSVESDCKTDYKPEGTTGASADSGSCSLNTR